MTVIFGSTSWTFLPYLLAKISIICEMCKFLLLFSRYFHIAAQAQVCSLVNRNCQFQCLLLLARLGSKLPNLLKLGIKRNYGSHLKIFGNTLFGTVFVFSNILIFLFDVVSNLLSLDNKNKSKFILCCSRLFVTLANKNQNLKNN